MRPRMNLFRQMLKPDPVQALPGKKAPSKVPLQLIVATGVSAVIGLGLIATLLKFQHDESDIRSQIQIADAAGEEALHKSEEAIKAIEAAKASGRNIAAENKEAATNAMGLDGTWTSLLWKLATFSATFIMVQRMELTQAGGVPGGGPKVVTIDGQAKSLVNVRDWLSGLVVHLPGYSFVMDQQTQIEDPRWPVKFKVTARAL